jgi:CBS domain-containing protein
LKLAKNGTRNNPFRRRIKLNQDGTVQARVFDPELQESEVQTEPEVTNMATPLVQDWMTPNPITVVPKTTLPDAHKLMTASNIRRLPVVDRGQLVGIVTLGDVREAQPSDATTLSIYELNYLLSKLTVDKIMTREPLTVSPQATIRDAARLMLEHKIGGLPVMEGERLVGIITESDIFRILAQEPEPHPLDRLQELQVGLY